MSDSTSERVVDTLRRWFGIVKIRQFADRLKHRLSFVPGLYVVGALVLVQCTLWFDRSLTNVDVPQILSTTVGSARAVFTAIAGGLITSITLVLSMMLVAVQLASSQFSPRTLRDWLGDRLLKHTIGVALGTTVFCLLALRSTREFGEGGGAIVPHGSVIIGVTFGVVSLFAVVRSVDHITHSLMIGSVARRIAGDTISVVEQGDEVRAGQNPSTLPGTGDLRATQDDDAEADNIPADAVAIESPASGWVQQINVSTLLDRLNDGATGYVVVPLGGFVPANAPLMWVSPPPSDDDPCRTRLLEAFAIGETRTLQQDIAFGILQLTDIAVRALSPGINDPSSASDIVVHLGDVLLALWSQPTADAEIEQDGRKIVRREPHHEEYLTRALDPIRRYGRADPDVLATVIRTVKTIKSESIRRQLPGPIGPLDDLIAATLDSADTTAWSPREISGFARLGRATLS